MHFYLFIFYVRTCILTYDKLACQGVEKNLNKNCTSSLNFPDLVLFLLYPTGSNWSMITSIFFPCDFITLTCPFLLYTVLFSTVHTEIHFNSLFHFELSIWRVPSIYSCALVIWIQAKSTLQFKRYWKTSESFNSWW